MQPLTLVTTRSPDRVTPAIASGCARLVPGETPVFVDRQPFAGVRINKCTFNVQQFLTENPGEMVLGWEVCVWDGVLLDCIGHAVVKHEERLCCVTPSKYGDSRLLFVPDQRMSFDFNDPMARMPAKQVPLSTRPEVLRFIELDAAEHAIKIKYPVSSGQIMVQGQDALKRTGQPSFGSPRKPEPERARLWPYLGLSPTPTRPNGGQRGPIGEIERVGPETGHALPPDALSGAVTGFQGES